MRRILATAAVAVAMLLLTPMVPAAATPPAGVEIVVPDFEGAFVATGPAVDDGVICGTGEVETTFVKPSGFQSNQHLILKVGKLFTCDDGTGTFSAKLEVRIDFDTGVSFQWVIKGGTGDYERLRGSGSGFVVTDDTDVYQGGLHIN